MNEELQKIEAGIIALYKKYDQLKSSSIKQDKKSQDYIKSLLLCIIEVLDAFDRVLKNIESKGSDIDRQTKIWIGNFKSVYKLFERTLSEQGIAIIEAPDGKAIPGFHYIEGTQHVDGHKDGTIIEEIKKGYLWQGEVLREARVIVAKKESTESNNDK